MGHREWLVLGRRVFWGIAALAISGSGCGGRSTVWLDEAGGATAFVSGGAGNGSGVGGNRHSVAGASNVAGAAAGGVSSIAAGAAGSNPSQQRPLGPFTVSDYFVVRGLGDGQDPKNLQVDVNQHCKSRPAGTQGDCYRFSYQFASESWTGASWVPRAGSEPILIEPARLHYLTFWAAVDYAPQTCTFIAGGIQGRAEIPPVPGDDQFSQQTLGHLTTDWQKFTIYLPTAEQQQLEPIHSLVGALTWSLNTLDGPDRGARPQVLYLDGIVYE